MGNHLIESWPEDKDPRTWAEIAADMEQASDEVEQWIIDHQK